MWGRGKPEDVWCAVSTGSSKFLHKQWCFLNGPGMKSSHLHGQATAATVLPSVYVCHEDMIDKPWQWGGGEVEDSVGLAKDSFRERHAVSKLCEEQMLGGLLGKDSFSLDALSIQRHANLLGVHKMKTGSAMAYAPFIHGMCWNLQRCFIRNETIWRQCCW